MKLKLSPLLLLLALICFALPFVQVSCVNDSPKATDSKTTLSDTPPPAKGDSMTAQSAVPDTAKPAPKPATPETPEVVKLYTYTGLNMVLGTEPHNHLADAPKDKADPKAKPAPAKTDLDSKTTAEARETKEETRANDEAKPAEKTEPKAKDDQAVQEDKGPKNQISIYALLAFILIFVALLLSLLKPPFIALIVGFLSFVATVLLYIVKLYFPGYFLTYTQLDPQALQILTIKFTPWYWAAFILPLFAMVDSVWRFTRTNNPVQETYEEPIALEPMDDYDETGELIHPVITDETDEAVVLVDPPPPVEPIETLDVNEQDPPLT